MSPEQDNFESLRRLLALKRHEQPPPGFFDELSRRVMVRIKTGDQGEDSPYFGIVFWEAPWLQRLWTMVEARPALARAFGLAVCGLLISGVVYSALPDSSGAVQPVSLQATTFQVPEQPQGAVFVSSTNGFLPDQPRDSLFEQFRNSQKPQLVDALVPQGAN